MFDIRRDVFVVRMGGGKRRNVGVGLRIVPVQFLCAAPHLIAIADNLTVQFGKGEFFADNEPITSHFQITSEEGGACATPNNRQR